MKEQIDITINNIENSLATNEEKESFKKLIEIYPFNYFDRNNLNGHITGSMLVFSDDGEYVLLTHHKKLGKWLQLGGHNDSLNNSILDTAIKEMEEEGFDDKRISYNLLSVHPIDLDVHSVGNHNHYDICFATTVSKNEQITCSHESNNVEWKKISDVLTQNLYDLRLKRMINKVLDNNLLNVLIKKNHKI